MGKSDERGRGWSPALNMEVQELDLAVLFGINLESSQEIKTCLTKADNLSVFSDDKPPSTRGVVGEVNLRVR
jgi:hypothetical protein